MSYILVHNPSRTRDRRLAGDVAHGIDDPISSPPHTPEHLPIQLVVVGVVPGHLTCKAQTEIREIQDEHAKLNSSSAYKLPDPQLARLQMGRSLRYFSPCLMLRYFVLR